MHYWRCGLTSGQGDNHFLSRASHTVSFIGQDAIGLYFLGRLLVHSQPPSPKRQVLCFPKPALLYRVATQMQYPAFGLTGCHEVGLCPLTLSSLS